MLLEFVEGRGNLEEEINRIKVLTNESVKEGSNRIIEMVKTQLEEYFDGKRSEFFIPLKFVGTEFQKRVWSQLTQIPFGKQITYKDQAIAMGNAEVIRASASANGQNKIAIVVPCHRVVGSNGDLTGYAGGVSKKKWLLEHESNQMSLF